MKISKIPNFCQDIGLDELFLEKNTVSSIRFLFYANGDKIGLAAFTSVSRAPNNALFELRLKINKTVNLAIEYLNEKNTCLQTV